MTTSTDRIVAELQRQHAGEPWHGPSRASVLAGITAAQAAWQPAGGGNSIWALVLHMRSWTREVLRRALTGKYGEPLEGDFPPVPKQRTEQAWAETLASLESAHAELIAAVRGMSDEQLGARVGVSHDAPGGTGISTRAMLYSLAQHDVYHTGQVAILKRLAAAAGA